MMKKPLVVITSLAVLMIGEDERDSAHLTMINKSDTDIAIQLIGPDYKNISYLIFPEGAHIFPTIKTFTIEKEIHSMQLFYSETYDLIHGFSCLGAIPVSLVATREIRLNIQPCGQIPPTRGSTTMMKSWRRRCPYIISRLPA